MNKGTASTIVLVSGGLLVALALIPAKGNVDSSVYKKIWAAGLLTVALGVAADFVPEVVGPFAVLVIIAAVLRNQGVLGGFIGGGSAVSSSSRSAAPAGVAGPTTGG